MTETAEIEAVSTEDAGSGATETKYPKVIKRHEDDSIIHYSPKPHEELDASTRN